MVMGQLDQQKQFITNRVTTPEKREEAGAIRRIRDRDSNDIVGYLYEWNTGQMSVMWKGKPCRNVIYE